jgi:hypothetical protein
LVLSKDRTIRPGEHAADSNIENEEEDASSARIRDLGDAPGERQKQKRDEMAVNPIFEMVASDHECIISRMGEESPGSHPYGFR